MITRLMIAVCALFLSLAAAPAQAQDQGDAFVGSWDLRLDGVTIFRFEIDRLSGDDWQGTWSRPDRFSTDGYFFAQLNGGVERVPSMTGIMFDGKVELSFDDPRPNAIPDIFRFELLDYSRVRMTYVGTDLAPFDLVRARPGDVIGNWDIRAVYSRSNPDAAGEAATIVAGSTEPPMPRPVPAQESAPVAAPLATPVPAPAPSTAQAEPAPEPESRLDAVLRRQERRVGANFLDGL